MTERSQTIVDYPGVKLGFAGVFCVLGAILWTVVQPASDVPMGGAEILAMIGGLVFLAAVWRGGTAFANEETDR